jgi:transcriptional regulator with XRE-family HTH domain
LSVALPIAALPVADWATVAQRARTTRESAGLSVAAAAEAIGVPRSDLEAFESGEAVLGVFDLQALADLYGTTTGAWFHGDERPVFRGADTTASREATQIGVQLMSEYLGALAIED